MLGLATALKARDAEVLLAANGHFKGAADKAGVAFQEIGSVEKFDDIAKKKEVWHPRKGMKMLLKDVYLPAVEQVYDLIKANRNDRTVVVASVLAFGARIAHDKFKVPLVTLQLQPSVFWSPSRPAKFAGFGFVSRLPYSLRKALFALVDKLLDWQVAPHLNAFNRSVGLPPVRHVMSSWAVSPQTVVGLFPEWFARPASDWPANTRLVGFAGFDRLFSYDAELSAEAVEFLSAGKKPVVFTPGTAMHHAKRFFEVALQAVQRTGRRAIFLTLHRENLPPKLPDNVAHFDYIPLSLLLERSAMIVHHGGIGTVTQGLAAGIPQIITPFSFDQPDNAARIEAVGAGGALRRLDAKALADMMELILNDDNIKARCAELAARISFDETIEAACRAIEGAMRG